MHCAKLDEIVDVATSVTLLSQYYYCLQQLLSLLLRYAVAVLATVTVSTIAVTLCCVAYCHYTRSLLTATTTHTQYTSR
jgi:hypothetical protein